MAEPFEYIINISQDFITLINRDYSYEVVNDSYCRAIGKNKCDIVNRTVSQVWGEERFTDTLKAYLDKCFGGNEVHYIEKFKFGLEQRYMHVSYYPFSEDDSDNITHVCVFSHDITKLGEIESKLINYEYRDPVTGLFNRRSLEIILDMELEQAKRSVHEKLRGILYIGIENLTTINRQHGHSIGNLLLENAGLQVKEMLRSSDYIFRYEGHELVVILTRLARDTDAARVAEKICTTLSTPYVHKNFSITLDCCIGIALYPDDGDNHETILHHAITALGEAKSRNKSCMMYDPRLHESSMEKLQLERDMKNAFQEKQFLLYYQPIVDMEGTIKGAEALIRWNHPEHGLISPAQFIPLAEETGIVREIGKWALFTATRQLKQWVDDYPLYVSINISAPEFLNPTLKDVVAAALKQAGNLDAGHLKLEITESQGMQSPETSVARIEEILGLGVEVYIDDFGTGQSSLNYLKNLPVPVLKIDKVFVDPIEDDQEELSFIESIIMLVKSRGKKVIVEGVSTARQWELLDKIGCELMQGYHFSKPLPADEFHQLLLKGASLPLS